MIYIPNRADRRRARKSAPTPRFVKRGNRWLVFLNDRLVRTMPVFSGGADKTVRVRLEALVAGYQAQMASAAASTKAFGANVLSTAKDNSAAFTAVGLASVAMGAAILLGFKKAVGAAIEFESSFAGVRKTVNASEPEFQALAAGLRKMATEIPVNVNELNRIAEAAGQLGIKKENILDFTRTMADLGVTTNLSSDEAATALARLANITQMPQSEFDRLGSTVVALGNNLATTEREIVAMGLRIAGAGKQIGLTEAEILSFAGALSSVGIEAQAGGTAISRVMMQIASEVETGGDKLRQFAAVAGMSTAEFKRAFQQDAAGAIVSFIEGLGNLEGSGMSAIAVLDAMGITEIRVRDALLRTAGAGDILRGSLDLGTAAWKENSALTTEAEQRYKTVESQIQLFKNSVNDLAISIGQALLPAIGAMAKGGAAVADVLNALPGPVKMLVSLFAGLAGTLLLVGGGFLMMAPKIAAAQGLLAGVGGAAGAARAGLSATANFLLGPWGLALAAATIGLTIWADAKRAAKARVDEYVTSLQADSDAVGSNTAVLGENTRATVVNRLEKQGLLEMADRAGISLSLLTDAVMGNAGAQAELARQIKASLGPAETDYTWGRRRTNAAQQLTTALDRESAALLEGQEAVNRKADAMETGAESGWELEQQERRLAEATKSSTHVIDGWAASAMKGTRATDDTTEATDDLSGSMDDLEGELEETKSAADQLTDALDMLTGGALDTERATVNWKDSLARLQDEIKDGTKTLNINTDAGRDNRRALESSITAAFDHAKAVADQTGSVEKGTQTFQGHIRQLMNVAEQSGISRGEVRDYIRQLNLTPKDVKSMLKLLGVDQAVRGAQNVKSNIDAIPSSKTITITTVQVTGKPTGTQIHSGGVAGATHAKRYHDGGFPGLRSDEVPAILQKGELVLSRSQVATFGELLARMPRFHDGGSVGTGSHSVTGDTINIGDLTIQDAPKEVVAFFRDLPQIARQGA